MPTLENEYTKINIKDNENEIIQKEYLTKYFTEKELDKTAHELIDMEKHSNKYKSYNNVDDLFKDLDNEY